MKLKSSVFPSADGSKNAVSDVGTCPGRKQQRLPLTNEENLGTGELPFQMLTHRWSGSLGDERGCKAATQIQTHTSAQFWAVQLESVEQSRS